MSDIGVSFQTDGTLKLDASKLNAALSDPNKDVSTLFAAIAKPTDSLVSFISAKSDATVGKHALNITRLATQGTAVGSQAANTTIVAGVNDTLTLEVDGQAATITLAAGSYTAAALSAELQAKINGVDKLSENDISVVVSQNSGTLTLTSDRFGSASIVKVVGGNAKSDLFGTATSTDGVDVAGTLGGVTATGSGKKLTAQGITLEIDGGSLGARGDVRYAKGFASQLSDMAKALLSDDGLLDGRVDGLNRSIKDLEKRQEDLKARLELTEKRYRAQFTALDTMMSSMQQTSTYLAQQLANLPGSSSK